MAADGSIVISAKMNVGQAEKDLAKLKGKIEKTENDIASITKKRDEASEKGALGAAQLDEEKRILAELKQQLLDLQATAKDKSLFSADRAAASAQIPDLREQISEQQQRVNALQSEWNKIENSLDRYNAQLADANDMPVSAAPIMPVSAAPEPIVRSVSYAGEPKSDFLELVASKDADRAWEVMDRIMDELKVINPKSYDGYMARLRAI